MASGLFAEHGLDVELVAPRRHGGATIEAGSPPPRPAFAVAGVYHHLSAGAAGRSHGRRFVAVVHQRSPLAAFVAADSALRVPADLAGRRVAASTAPWFDLEYRAGLEALGLEPPVRVPPKESGERLSLAAGDVDVIGSWAEAVAVIRKRAAIPVRAVPFGPAVYTTGLVADDAVPVAVVRRTVDALAEAFVRQREQPTLGLADLCRAHPGVEGSAALEEWAVLEEYVFDGHRPGAMDAGRWRATIDHAARVHGFPALPLDAVCRPELLAATVAAGR